MARDVLAEMGYLALGSRLKRLAERMQADATRAFADRGIPVQATHFPLLAALATYGPMTVSEAVEAVGISQPAVTRIHNSLQALGHPAAFRLLHLQELIVAFALDLDEVRHFGHFDVLAEELAEAFAASGGLSFGHGVPLTVQKHAYSTACRTPRSGRFGKPSRTAR